MNYICALLVVEDMAKSRDFYENLFGLEVEADLGGNVSYKGGLALQDKKVWIHISNCKEEDIHFGKNSYELYFEEDNLDEFVKILEEKKVPLMHPILEADWGQRSIRFYDPDGHLIEVGESMPFVVIRFLKQGLSIEETMKKTMMPQPMVTYLKGQLDAGKL